MSPRAQPSPSRPVRHVYAHWPFCIRKCPYCDFNSHAGRAGDVEHYIEALAAEARACRPFVAAETIFVGGGTPTHAAPGQIERYLCALREAFGSEQLAEFTVEANPGTVDAAVIGALRRAGVDRVSLGAQSFSDVHLRTLGRIHTADDIVRSVEGLRAGGVTRLSLDLILAIPGQTLLAQEHDLEHALALEPEHLSAYVLTYELGTPFRQRVREGSLPSPDADRELAHLHMACRRAREAGLSRYEISNFAVRGAECRHNLAYWQNAEWFGLGAGAHSHVGGQRWKNVDDPAIYARGALAGVVPVEFEERITAPMRLFESLMMGLRLLRGIDLDEVADACGLDARDVHGQAIAQHEEDGLLLVEGSRMRLTERGLDLANYVITSFAAV